MKIALYILATFLETGLGIHIFAQAFPKREYKGKKQKAAEVVLISALIPVSYTHLDKNGKGLRRGFNPDRNCHLN